MSRTVRRASVVQSVRNAAHNLLLFRCATHCPMQPLKSYNRMQMQLASSAAFPESLLAAMPQLREKPRLGFSSKNLALHQGHEVCNSTTALGFRAALHLERIRSRYTGKERDTESGNDYFGARYYSSAMGRFMSPDWSAQEEPVPYAKLDNPQTLNLYSYVENNPLTSTDPTGHEGCCDVLPTMDEVDAVAKPLIDSAVTGVEDAAGVTVQGAVGVVGFLFTAGVASTAPAKNDQLYNEETGERYTPEPQTSTNGAGARQGGGPPYENTPENQARMAQGKPPIGKDGKPVELHHTDQTQGGKTQEMTRTDHRAGANYAANHTNTGQKPSQIDRKKFAQQRRAHWKNKVKSKPTSWRRTFRSRPHSQWVTAYQNR